MKRRIYLWTENQGRFLA